MFSATVGRTLRTIGSASDRLEALGDRTMSAVGALTSAKRWFGQGGGDSSASENTVDVDGAGGAGGGSGGAAAHATHANDVNASATGSEDLPRAQFVAGEAPGAAGAQAPVGEPGDSVGSVAPAVDAPAASSFVGVEVVGLFDRHIEDLERLLGTGLETIDRSLLDGQGEAMPLLSVVQSMAGESG